MNTINELKTEEPMPKQEQIRVLKMFNEDLAELLRVVKEWEQRSKVEKNEIQ